MAALLGGSWSTVQTFDEGTQALAITGHFALTRYTFGNESVRYIEGLSETGSDSVNLYLDYSNLIKGAKPTLAFGILVSAAYLALLFFHACLFTNKMVESIKSWIFPTLGFLVFLHCMAIMMWATIGHWAAQHLTVDIFPGAYPIASFGWCFQTSLTCLALILLNMMAVQYYIRQTERALAVTAIEQSASKANVQASQRYTPTPAFSDVDDQDTKLFD